MGFAAPSWPLATRAQKAPAIARVGYLSGGSAESNAAHKLGLKLSPQLLARADRVIE